MPKVKRKTRKTVKSVALPSLKHRRKLFYENVAAMFSDADWRETDSVIPICHDPPDLARSLIDIYGTTLEQQGRYQLSSEGEHCPRFCFCCCFD